MKKNLLFATMALALMFFTNNASAQLPAGSYGENFTMQDYLGTNYSLYSYTDAGKPVIIDFSAVWCSYCWNYHQTGALETYYNTYGPIGDNTSMVFWIEGDQNPVACLQGTGCGTYGDWTAGTTFPLILTVAPNDAQVVTDYSIGYYPTIYLVCPNRAVTEVGQLTSPQLHTAALGCPAAGTNALDAAVWSAEEPDGTYCSTSVTPQFKLQNYGTTALTSCNVVVKLDGITASTTPWTGTLNQYDVADVVIPAVNSITDGAHTMTFEITSPNGGTDANSANNTQTNNFTIFSDGANVQIQLLTDDYPSETSWEIKDGATVLASSDPYTTAEHTYNNYVCLEKNHCYDFVIYDAYGDGMTYGVTGNANIIFGGDTIGTISGSGYTTQGTVNFCTTVAGIEENSATAAVTVYPNPATTSATIAFSLIQSATASFDVYNVLGEKVTSVAETTYNTGAHNIILNTENLGQGIYYLNSIIDGKSNTQKLTVVK
jgi:hypothetical protein